MKIREFRFSGQSIQSHIAHMMAEFGVMNNVFALLSHRMFWWSRITLIIVCMVETKCVKII